MPRRVVRKDCACGCGSVTEGGNFLPGHDQRVWGAIVREVGSVEKVREIIEKELGYRIKVRPK